MPVDGPDESPVLSSKTRVDIVGIARQSSPWHVWEASTRPSCLISALSAILRPERCATLVSKTTFSVPLDSLGVTAILMTLARKYDISLEAEDATPRNLKNLDSIVAMVERKQQR